MREIGEGQRKYYSGVQEDEETVRVILSEFIQILDDIKFSKTSGEQSCRRA